MNSSELYTVKRLELPIVVIIMNNGALGMVRQQQRQGYGARFSQTDLEMNPDFSMLARAYGIDGYSVKSPVRFAETLRIVKEKGCAAVIDCKVDKNETARVYKPRQNRNGANGGY